MERVGGGGWQRVPVKRVSTRRVCVCEVSPRGRGMKHVCLSPGGGGGGDGFRMFGAERSSAAKTNRETGRKLKQCACE